MYREMGLANTTPRSSHDDATLLTLVRRGDDHAIAALYDRYSRIVYSVALRVLRDPASAEDILQDIFIDIWRTPEQYVAVRGSFGAWLTLVSRNRSIDALRRKRPIDTIDDISLSSRYNLASEAERSMVADQAKSIVTKLLPDQRKTLEMAFFDGLTHVEIAEMTSDSSDTVKTRIRSALTNLRKAFLA